MDVMKNLVVKTNKAIEPNQPQSLRLGARLVMLPRHLRTAAALTLAIAAVSASAQRITGSLTGTVRDETGALLPNAQLSAVNNSTGVSYAATSGSDGAYTIQYLPVGTYTVNVTSAGFKNFSQQNVVISVDQVQPLNVSLAVGASSETVTVTDAPPAINTVSSEIGRTVSPAEINALPLVNRNAYTEISLTPGVQSNSASSQSNPSGSANFVLGVPSTQVVINGGADGGVPMVSFYLDGGINMTGLRNYGNPLPNPDALEEFRVETSNFAAQYGRMSGGVVTAVTRSGTNSFHGTVFEFNRNTALNATQWGSLVNLPYHRNQFGVTVGGPVKRDKAFFFFSYGGLRQTVGQQLSGAIVPTALERLGDFTQSKAANPKFTTPYFPGTKTPLSGTNSSPNCQVVTVGCAPQALLDQTAANILKTYVPLPNLAGNGYTGNYTVPTTQDEYLGKYDQVVGAKDHVSVSFFTLKSVSGAYGGGNIPYSVNQSFARQYNTNISDIHTFNDFLANQIWFTFTRVAGGRVNLPAVALGDLGSSFTIQGPKSLPQLAVSGYFSAGGALAGPVSNTNLYALRDVFTLVKGRHNLSIGGEFSLEKDAIVGNLYNFGVFNFIAGSGLASTNNALVDFITGRVANMEQDTPYHGLLNYFYGAGFVQDDWKATPRLTLNLGLRYDVQQSPVESQNLTATFVPGRQSTLVPSAPLGMLFPGDTGVGRGIAPTRWGHVSPRVGFALDVFGDGKTAVRGGAGLFYGSVSANEWNQPANAQPFAVRQTFNSITSFSDVYSNKTSFPNGDPFPYTYNPANPRFLANASIETINPNYKWPQSYQFNLAVEQKMPGGITLQTAYVANLVHHLAFGRDFNAPQYAAGASTTQASLNARRPYDPGVLGQVIYIDSPFDSNYHSLQVSARRALTNHLLLNGFIVWSKSLWTGQPSAVGLGTAQDFNALYLEHGPADNDRRNVASLSGVWNLDYYSGNSSWKRNAINGWSISAIASLQSGQPFNITTGIDRNLDGYNNDRPDLVVGQVAKLNPHRNRLTAAVPQWFNTAAFVANGPGVAGGVGPGGADGNTPRNYLYGPGYRDIDLGISRKFTLYRETKLELRGDATNAFNLVSLNNPGTNLSSSTFGRITSASAPRLIQLGARFSF